MNLKPMIIFMILVGSCSVKPDDPGLCKLNCSEAIIGGSDTNVYEIKRMNSPPAISCTANAAEVPLSFPVLAHFVITEKFTQGGQEVTKPVPNISFEPLITGYFARVFNDENVGEDEDGNLTPARYLGITTPKSNWCSDACGVMAIEFVPSCLPSGQTNNINVQLHSGSEYSDDFSFSIQTEEAQ